MNDDDVKEIIENGLRDGLKARIAQIFQNLSQAGEVEAEQRFRNGLDRSVVAYTKAKKIVEDCIQDDYGD